MWSKQQTLAGSPALPGSRSSARLGSSLQIKGEISGAEDLQIDGIVEGPIALDGHELIIGSAAQLNSEIHAGEVVVYGKLVGNVHARGRVEITKDGSITGDLACARISIADGAHFKGRIEIDPTRSNAD
jgi:cytoskeletal protein CcmA (bactofilin family)